MTSIMNATATPAIFSGAWKRRSVSIGGERPVEPATVLWLQAGDDFIDIRNPRVDAPLSGPGAFGGRTTWNDPSLTWEQLLDSAAPGAADSVDVGNDIGTLIWQDGLIHEHGSFDLDGSKVEFVEVWERVSAPEDVVRPVHRFARGSGLVICIGAHRVGMVIDDRTGRWAAIYQQHGRRGWRTVIRLGPPDLSQRLAGELDATTE
jgi:hypothetical protein